MPRSGLELGFRKDLVPATASPPDLPLRPPPPPDRPPLCPRANCTPLTETYPLALRPAPPGHEPHGHGVCTAVRDAGGQRSGVHRTAQRLVSNQEGGGWQAQSGKATYPIRRKGQGRGRGPGGQLLGVGGGPWLQATCGSRGGRAADSPNPVRLTDSGPYWSRIPSSSFSYTHTHPTHLLPIVHPHALGVVSPAVPPGRIGHLPTSACRFLTPTPQAHGGVRGRQAQDAGQVPGRRQGGGGLRRGVLGGGGGGGRAGGGKAKWEWGGGRAGFTIPVRRQGKEVHRCLRLRVDVQRAGGGPSGGDGKLCRPGVGGREAGNVRVSGVLRGWLAGAGAAGTRVACKGRACRWGRKGQGAGVEGWACGGAGRMAGQRHASLVVRAIVTSGPLELGVRAAQQAGRRGRGTSTRRRVGQGAMRGLGRSDGGTPAALEAPATGLRRE